MHSQTSPETLVCRILKSWHRLVFFLFFMPSTSMTIASNVFRKCRRAWNRITRQLSLPLFELHWIVLYICSNRRNRFGVLRLVQEASIQEIYRPSICTQATAAPRAWRAPTTSCLLLESNDDKSAAQWVLYNSRRPCRGYRFCPPPPDGRVCLGTWKARFSRLFSLLFLHGKTLFNADWSQGMTRCSWMPDFGGSWPNMGIYFLLICILQFPL